MPWPKIEPGDLRHQITFLSQVIGADASGANFTWAAASPPVTTRAKIVVHSPTESVQGGQDISKVIADVWIRWRPGVLPNMRFVTEQGTYYIVKSILNVEDRNVLLQMACEGLGPNS